MYQGAFFAQGEEATELLEHVDEHGADRTLCFLVENYVNELTGDESEKSPSGSHDFVYERYSRKLGFGWRITWNSQLGYVGLERFYKH